MARPILNRDDRLELRATKEEKRLLAAAAAYERLDVTSFIMRPYPRRARWWTATSASSFPSATGHECWNCWRTRRSRRPRFVPPHAVTASRPAGERTPMARRADRPPA